MSIIMVIDDRIQNLKKSCFFLLLCASAIFWCQSFWSAEVHPLLRQALLGKRCRPYRLAPTLHTLLHRFLEPTATSSSSRKRNSRLSSTRRKNARPRRPWPSSCAHSAATTRRPRPRSSRPRKNLRKRSPIPAAPASSASSASSAAPSTAPAPPAAASPQSTTDDDSDDSDAASSRADV